MRNFNNLRRPVAVGVIVTFLFFVQLAVTPLPAGQSRADCRVAGMVSGSGDGPGAIERISAPVHAKKKSPLVPILIGVAAVGAVAAVLVLVLKKNLYDITGDWDLTLVNNGYTIAASMACTGSKESGTVSYLEYGAPGSGDYTVKSNDDVQITIHFGMFLTITLQGKFIDADHLAGTETESGSATVGTFTAVRVSPAG